MISKGQRDSPQFFESWKKFGPWLLDDLNECVNFYFTIDRKNNECVECGGDGYNKESRHIVNSYYAFNGGIPWKYHITQDEVQALVDQGRLNQFTCDKEEGYVPTAEEINKKERESKGFGVHDAINRWILIDTRLKRLGIEKTCKTCQGNGYVYVEDVARVSLTLWILHPRKGCSRGIEVNNITQDDLPKIFEWLNRANERNMKRFSKIPK